MPARIGPDEAGHPWEWPQPGPEVPSRRPIQDHGGRTQHRTFYGPHLEPPGCAPALARTRPATPGNGPDLDRGAPVGGRPRTTVAGPRTGHSMVRTWNRQDVHQHWLKRCCLSPAGPRLEGDGPGQGRFPGGQLRQNSVHRRSKTGHSMVRTPLPGDPHQHSVPRGYVRSSGLRSWNGQRHFHVWRNSPSYPLLAGFRCMEPSTISVDGAPFASRKGLRMGTRTGNCFGILNRS